MQIALTIFCAFSIANVTALRKHYKANPADKWSHSVMTCSSGQTCTDEPSPWMVKNNHACSTWAYGLQNNCKHNSDWVSNKYCRQSCAAAGNGYDGDSCGQGILKTESMSKADYDSVVASIKEQHDRLATGCTATWCPQAEWTGCVLRVAGHDFMDFTGSKGGSDGCLDLHDPDNLGLHDCLYKGEFSGTSKGDGGVSLHAAYQKHCSKISLADFLVIAAEAVMEITRANVPRSSAINFKSGFRYGRTTATTCPWAYHSLPLPEDSCTAVQTTFVKQMGLSWTQTAALMGVHSLGRAHLKFSGFDGWWSDAENSRRFNNDYYISLLAKGWMRETLSTGKVQWARSDVGANEAKLGKEMMLDTDMCLAYTTDTAGRVELKAKETACCAWVNHREVRTGYRAYNNGEFCGDGLNDIPGGSGPAQRDRCCVPPKNHNGDRRVADCGDPDSPKGPAYGAIKDFANDEALWLRTFVPAWRKATENGFSNLKSLR